MKKHALILALATVYAMPAGAALFDRGGGLIYDDVLNITWLQDANLNGLLDWYTANSFAASLSIGGVTGWRLASADVNGDGAIQSCNGGGFNNCHDNELSYMYWVNGAGTYNPFINIQSNQYWSSAGTAYNPSLAVGFNFASGYNVITEKTSPSYAWAVHDGDVAAIPEPETYAMMLVGLSLVGFAGRLKARTGNRQLPA